MKASLLQETLKEKNYINFPYRVKKIRDRYLVTTDHGGWIVFNKETYDKFRLEKLTPEEVPLLEEKGLVITQRNIDLIISNYKQRYSFLYQGTSLQIILPTLRCNKKCHYCHSAVVSVNDKQFDMDEETAKKTVEFMFQSPSAAMTIEFQGGETLLMFPMFKKIVEYAEKLNKLYKKTIKFDLVTNMSLMNDNIMEYIQEHKINISSSVDGPAIVHDKNRPFESGAPTHDHVTKQIMKFQEKFKKRIGLLMVTTKHSLPYYKEIIDEYIRLGQKSIQIKYMNDVGFARTTSENLGYTFNEFKEFWMNSMNYIIKLNKKGVQMRERYVMMALQKILSPNDAGFTDWRSPSGSILSVMAYNYNGDIFSSDEGRGFEMFKLGNVKKHSYSEIHSSEKSQMLIKSTMGENFICDNCAYKPFCGPPAETTYAEQGTVIPKIPSLSTHKHFEMVFDWVFEQILFNPGVREILLSWISNLKNAPSTS